MALAALAAAALVPAASSLAQTESGPVRKAGWREMQLVVHRPDAAGIPQSAESDRFMIHLCTDPAIDRVSSPLYVNMRGRKCEEKTARSASGWTISGVCDSGSVRITQDAVATGDLNDRYHVDIDTHMDPLNIPGGGQTKMVLDARWMGQCPAGKKPGDAEGLPGGRSTVLVN